MRDQQRRTGYQREKSKALGTISNREDVTNEFKNIENIACKYNEDQEQTKIHERTKKPLIK